MQTFGVVTPTTGSDSLEECILSLRGQDCTHYIVVDGQQYVADVNKILLKVGMTSQVKMIWLEENVGKFGGNFYGHRVYAASPFLVNEDAVCFLDQDNTVQPNYIEEFQTVFRENKYGWAYTLRNIMGSRGEFVCQDNCESLGHWPVQFDKSRFHIDTGCFAIPRNLLVKISHNWMGGWGQDREFFAAMKSAAPDFGCTMKHTMNYRMGSETSRATTEMFLQGNKISWQAYTGERNYPWHEQRNPNTKQSMSFLYQTTSQRQPS